MKPPRFEYLSPRMDRRKLSRCLFAALFFVALLQLSAGAQQSQRLPRIGWLGNMAPPPPPVNQLDGFLEGLREAGFAEGQNVIIEYRWAEGRMDRLGELARELASQQVDVFMVCGA